MKLAVRIAETPPADVRPTGRDKTAADEAGSKSAFDNMMATLQSNGSLSKAAAPSPATQEPATARDATKRDPKAMALDSEAAAQPDISAVSTEESDGSPVSALLKRIKSNTDPSAPDVVADGTAARIDPALAAPLLSNLQAVAFAPAPDQRAQSPEEPQKSLQADVKLEAAAAAPAKIISDVSVETHVALTRGPRKAEQLVEDNAASASTPTSVPAEQTTNSVEPESKVFVESPAASRTAPADHHTVRGTTERASEDRSGQVASPNSRAGNSANNGNASRDNESNDHRTAPVTSKPAEDVSQTPPALDAQAPVKRIAATIVELAERAGSVTNAKDPSATTQLAPARTVTLQMSPANLGTVEVRLHLTGQALDVQLTVSEHETLGLVTRERDALTSALQGQNYEIHSLVIQDSSTTAPSGGTHVATHESSGDRPANHSSRENQGGSNGDRRDSQEPDRQGRGFRSRGEDRPSARTADGRSLFI